MATLLTSIATDHLAQRALELARLCGQLGDQIGLTGVCGHAAHELSDDLAREMLDIARIVSSAH